MMLMTAKGKNIQGDHVMNYVLAYTGIKQTIM